jgi:hypothetical protein
MQTFSLALAVVAKIIQELDSETLNFVRRQTKKNIPTNCLKPYYWDEKDEVEAEFEGESFQCDVLRFHIKGTPYLLTHNMEKSP